MILQNLKTKIVASHTSTRRSVIWRPQVPEKACLKYTDEAFNDFFGDCTGTS
jgi:hypothetical protein